jgi:hypothetical protein
MSKMVPALLLLPVDSTVSMAVAVFPGRPEQPLSALVDDLHLVAFFDRVHDGLVDRRVQRGG